MNAKNIDLILFVVVCMLCTCSPLVTRRIRRLMGLFDNVLLIPSFLIGGVQ